MADEIERIDARLRADVETRGRARKCIADSIDVILGCNQRIAKGLEERSLAEFTEWERAALRAEAYIETVLPDIDPDELRPPHAD